MSECREIRRFVMLHLEPFLSFLSSDKYIRLNTYRELKEVLKKEVFNSYKGENEDYIEFILERNFTDFENFANVNRFRDFYEVYKLFAKYSLIRIANSLISDMKINNYELYKFIGLYIEPLQILFSYLIHKGIPFDPKTFKETDFYEMDVLRNKKLGDLHIHAETSYLFRNLIEFLLRNYRKILTEAVKQDLNLLRDLNFIILTYKGLVYTLDRREIGVLYRLLHTDVIYIIPQTPVFERFDYRNFINGCLNDIFHNIQEEITLFFVVSLQKLNKIMNSLTFKGEYKGLKHMRKFFGSKVKKIFQKTRNRLNNNEIFIEPIQDNDYISYVEFRLSPEPEQIKFWISWMRNNNAEKPEIKFLIHYKKFKNINELYGFYYSLPKTNRAFLDLIRETENMFRFLVRNPEKADLIVGFDAASVEYWTPPWIFRDIFKFWKTFFKIYFHKNIGITFHAGEDFIDSATGLRYIYEAIKFLNADRIGHGLSMLIDFDKYHMKYSTMKFDLFHYFLHILWLFHLCFSYPRFFSKFKHHIEEALYDFLEEVSRLADNNFRFIREFIGKYLKNHYFLNKFYESLGFSEDLYRIAKARNDIFSRFLLNTIKENYKDITYAINTFKFMKQFVRFIIASNNKRIFTVAPLLSQDIMNYETQISFIKEISRFVASLANNRNVSLEICPSSNIVLYNIRSFKDHPALFGNNNNVKFSVNTDNPLLLNTNIILEHLLLYEASDGKTWSDSWKSSKFG